MARGAWRAGKIGGRIGSGHLNVFDDPTIEQSLGWYEHDDEGVRSSRTSRVEDGILTGHLQSRETAAASSVAGGGFFDARPTANMRAASYRFMPLIRMPAPGIGGRFHARGDDQGRQVGLPDIGHEGGGPSIDAYRYNWSISCRYASKIKGGEVTYRVRDVIVTGTAPEFFGSVDACGRDCDKTYNQLRKG